MATGQNSSHAIGASIAWTAHIQEYPGNTRFLGTAWLPEGISCTGTSERPETLETFRVVENKTKKVCWEWGKSPAPDTSEPPVLRYWAWHSTDDAQHRVCLNPWELCLPWPSERLETASLPQKWLTAGTLRIRVHYIPHILEPVSNAALMPCVVVISWNVLVHNLWGTSKSP